MQLHGIEFPEKAIAEFCRRHGVKRLALFGSILTDRFRPDSDIDLLVEFLPDQRMGLFGFAGMHLELTRLLGREVQLHTPCMLAPHYRDEVVRTAKVQYAA